MESIAYKLAPHRGFEPLGRLSLWICLKEPFPDPPVTRATCKTHVWLWKIEKHKKKERFSSPF